MSKEENNFNSFELQPIAQLKSCFKEKFGIPRQPGLVKSSTAKIEFPLESRYVEAVHGLEGFSHIWLITLFHQAIREDWKARIRPPRLGGNKSIGVFASRSPFRPNPIGLSAVRLDRIEKKSSKIVLHLAEVDLVDGTPILDIKPYVAYSDSIEDTQAGYTEEKAWESLPVQFSKSFDRAYECHEKKYPNLKDLIEEIVHQDPRPAYKKKSDEKQSYAFKLYDFDVVWSVENSIATIEKLRPGTPSTNSAES